MKALVWTGEKIELQEKKDPEITKDNHVKIKIHSAGICGTDLNIVKGQLDWPVNRIIGHEAVGIITEKGKDVTSFSIGDRVIIDPTQYCGKCFYCRKGLTNFCTNFDKYEVGYAVDGVFAEYYVGEDRFIYKIPDNMSWETAIMTEPAACVLHNVEESKIRPDESVLIIGGGPIGTLCSIFTSQLARLTCVTEIDKYRSNFIKNITEHVYNPEDLSSEKLKSINNDRKFDVVIDTVGNQMDFAFKNIEKGGRIVIMGLNSDYNYTINPTDLLSKGISILSFGEYHNYMESALLCISKSDMFQKLVTKQHKMENHDMAFAELLGFDPDTKQKNNINSMKTVLIP